MFAQHVNQEVNIYRIVLEKSLFMRVSRGGQGFRNSFVNVCHCVTFLDITSSCFLSLVPCLKFTIHNVAAKQVTGVSLVLKDSDTESENLSSLIRLSVSDSQKSDS